MTHNSRACCTLAPAVADYTPKGTFKAYSGVKTYVTGSATAKKAILWGYDIFGYSPGTLQGADILATAGYLVTIPDLLNNKFAEGAWFAPEPSDEQNAAKGEFFGYIQDVPQHLGRLEGALSALKGEFPSVDAWGFLGFCWGGKIAAITSDENTHWKVSVQSSPALIDTSDAPKITIPHAILASGDENADEVKAFEAGLKVEHFVETFSDMPHGWMGARAEFKDSKAKEAFEKGYSLAAGFFEQHL